MNTDVETKLMGTHTDKATGLVFWIKQILWSRYSQGQGTVWARKPNNLIKSQPQSPSLTPPGLHEETVNHEY